MFLLFTDSSPELSGLLLFLLLLNCQGSSFSLPFVQAASKYYMHPLFPVKGLFYFVTFLVTLSFSGHKEWTDPAARGIRPRFLFSGLLFLCDVRPAAQI